MRGALGRGWGRLRGAAHVVALLASGRASKPWQEEGGDLYWAGQGVLWPELALGPWPPPLGWAGQCWIWGPQTSALSSISPAHGENPAFRAHGLLRLAVPAHLIMWGQLDVDPDALPCPSANLSCLSKQGWQAEGHLSFACMDSPQDHFPAPALFFGST